MNFSDCIEHTGGVVEYSKDGRFVAISRAFDVFVSFYHHSISIYKWTKLTDFCDFLGVRDGDFTTALKIPIPRPDLPN